MSLSLLDLLGAWPDEPILLVLDGAVWHKARALPVPERLRLWPLPPYYRNATRTERTYLG